MFSPERVFVKNEMLTLKPDDNSTPTRRRFVQGVAAARPDRHGGRKVQPGQRGDDCTLPLCPDGHSLRFDDRGSSSEFHRAASKGNPDKWIFTVSIGLPWLIATAIDWSHSNRNASRRHNRLPGNGEPLCLHKSALPLARVRRRSLRYGVFTSRPQNSTALAWAFCAWDWSSSCSGSAG